MDLEIVTVGSELLLGFTLDSNSAHLSQALQRVGVRVVRTTSVDDELAAIGDAVGGALDRTGFVIVTGGLGPTRDDVTKHAVAALFDAPLELDEAHLAWLRERFARITSREFPESNRTQAMVPVGATVLRNRRGTAPGLWLEGDRGVAVMLPGVPSEMRGIVEEEVLPRLADRGAGDGRVTRTESVRTWGVPESRLADMLSGFEEGIAPLTLAYSAAPEGVTLRVTAWSEPVDRVDALLEDACRRIRDVVGDAAYDGHDLAQDVIEKLRARQWRMSVAESCTGGLIGQRITAVAGSSDVFAGGIIAYENRVKQGILGVEAALLAEHGAVSEPVALAMARGARRLFETDTAVAVTGVAGPGGGTEAKPVGTVWLAVDGGSAARAVLCNFPGDRDEVRRRSAQAALNLLRLYIVRS